VCIWSVGTYIGMQNNAQADTGYMGREVADYLISQEVGNVDFVINYTDVQSFVYDVEFFDIRQKERIDLGWGDFKSKMDDYANTNYEDVHNIILIEGSEERAQSQLSEMENSDGIVICEVQDFYVDKPLKQIEVADKVWGIYSYPVHCVGEVVVSTDISPSRIILDKATMEDQVNVTFKTDMPEGEWDIWVNDWYYGKTSVNQEGYGSLLIDSKIIFSSEDMLELTIGNKEIYLESPYTTTYQIALINVEDMKIGMSHPSYLTQGEHFNVQPSGESAMTLEIVGCPIGSKIAIYINNEFVGYGGVGEDMKSSILVPQKYYLNGQSDMSVTFRYVDPVTDKEYGESEAHIIEILPNGGNQ